MSTKTCLPSRLSVDIGPTIPLLVSSFDTCSLSPMQPLVLLLDVDISRLIIYYTDNQDVDEDLRTISAHGGNWYYANEAGVTHRHMFDASTNVYDIVASSNMQNIKLYGFA